MCLESGKVKKYALLGAAGFIAPRHVRAIKETGGELVAACDPHDSVGYLDGYFPECRYFREYERFMRFIDQSGEVDTVVVCTPNLLHDTHSQQAMRAGCDVICEKPAVIHLHNLDRLMEDEVRTGKKVNVILQLRHHQAIIELGKDILEGKKKHIDLTYITPRGRWYHDSWKGDAAKSGGLAVNIGVHLFDMLTWVYGEHRGVVIESQKPDMIAGDLYLKWADVSFFMSLNGVHRPDDLRVGSQAYRVLRVDGREVDFSDITNLHTVSYEKILAGEGWRLEDCVEATRITEKINQIPPHYRMSYLNTVN